MVMNFDELRPGDMLIEHGWRNTDYSRTTVAWLIISTLCYHVPKKKRPRDKKPRVKDRLVKLMLMRLWSDDVVTPPVIVSREHNADDYVSLDTQVIRGTVDLNVFSEQLFA